jgi:acyl-CoA dehydrogenase
MLDPFAAHDDYPELRESVARIARDYPSEYWRSLEDEGGYPSEFVAALTEAGFLAALVPEQYGGAGLPLRAAAVILETINANGCNASQCHAQMYTMGVLVRHGSEEQRQAYLPRIASGDLRLQAFAVTEPTTGSDTTQIKTRAELTGEGYRINGQKVWTSRALHSDLMVLLARTSEPPKERPKWDGLSLFLVDIKASLQRGLSIRPLEAMINHNTTELFFSDLLVPADNRIGEEGMGFRYLLDGLNAERILVASECIGDGRFFLQRACAYANERQVFGRSIGKNQGVQFPLARAFASLTAADLVARRAAERFESKERCGEDANIAKLLASEAAWNAAEATMQTFGGFAFAREYDIERKWRDCRLYQIAPVSTNLILSYLAEHALGLERSF